MNTEKYPVVISGSSMVYEFVSNGINGCVTKFVVYSRTRQQNLFNLGFGDKCIETGEIDDEVITNNGDSIKVLLTVASTMYTFMQEYPDAMVYLTGSCKARTRLYRMGISNHLEAIVVDFEVFGMRDETWQPFVRNIEYEAFLIRKKTVNL